MNASVDTTFEATVFLARLAETNYIFCSLEPVAEIVEGRWIDIDDKAARFPRGGIRTKPAELGQSRQVGSLWVFSTSTLRADTKTQTVTKPARAIPIVDMSDVKLADARKKLLETGITLPEHQERMAVVLLEGDLYAYLKFGRSPQRQHQWTARLAEGRIELRRAVKGWSEAASTRSGKYFPMLGEPSGELVRTEDWSTDAEFLAKVAEGLSAAARSLGALTDRGAEQSVRRIEKAIFDSKLGSADADGWRSMVERLRAEWPAMSQGAEAVRTIGALLLGSDDGRRLLQLAVDNRVDEMVKELELRAHLELEDRFAPAQAELQRLQAAVATCRQKEKELAEAVRARTQELERATRTLEARNVELGNARRDAEAVARTAAVRQASIDAAHATLEEAKRNTEKLSARAEALRQEIARFADRLGSEFEAVGNDDGGRLAAFAARLLAALGPDAAKCAAPAFPSASPPWWGASRSEATTITTADLAGRVREEATLHGLVSDDLLIVDAFARAGELVVLTGQQSELALEAYSRVVGAGQARTVPVDPGVIGIDDLWRTPATGRPTALAWAWHRALSMPAETVVVCLRGIDMSPAAAWMPALEAALRSDLRPRNLLVLATTAAVHEATDNHDGETGSAWVRRHAVGLRVRAGREGGLSHAILGDRLRVATNLVLEPSAYEPPYKALKALAEGHTPQVTRRTIRFLKALAVTRPTDAPTIAEGWATLLRDGVAQGLPAALSGGDEDLRDARFLD